MGALNGSISYSRFYVEGDLPQGFKERFVEALRARAFEPLTAESEEEEHVGWCSIEHPLDLELDAHKLFFNSYLNVGWRVDRWRIPGPILKAYYTEAERAYLAENNKERLSRSEKVDLKAVVTAELKQKLMPTMKVIDVSWNVHTGVLRFWNQSAKTAEHFQAYFEETFEGLRLIPDTPYTAAIQYALDDTQVGLLADLTPTVLHADLSASLNPQREG